MMFLQNSAILAFTTSSVFVSYAAADTWRSDLDWDTFAAKLSPTASLIDTDFSDFLEDCLPEFRDNDSTDRTNYALIDKPSGMCVSQLFCSYEYCWPRPNATISDQAQRTADDGGLGLEKGFDALGQEIQGWLEDPQNPSLNLPSKVLFPVVQTDVVHAIQFAQDNGLEISVKNSGHSIMGASTKKDTLHLNMNRFTEYSPTSIVDCENGTGEISNVATSDLGDRPCSLAAARNKPAYVRVGGGENWNDVYRSVEAANTEQGDKYHAVGGAAGTVSPMGWTFQGGLAGTMGGRMYGFGVDQVLQVEMVLPNGAHVKFGPVEWEDASADGFIVPKTTSVAGVCRSNPEEFDESLWEWTECSEDINFDDLWFAINGGGGGTWGVVTSIYLQLHDYLTPRSWGLGADNRFDDCDLMVKGDPIFLYYFEFFRLMYVTIPDYLNVSQADSDACGFADQNPTLMCYGDVPYETLVKEWEKFMTANFDPLTAAFSLDDALACPGTREGLYVDRVRVPEGPYIGQAADNPYPSIRTISNTEQTINVLVPQKYIDENFDPTWAPGSISFYYAFGSGSLSASDQANSMGPAHRTAGYKRLVPAADFFPSMFGEMFDISDKTNFPSIQGSNHAGPAYMGPLKDDWTKVCPVEWTQAERDEKCISIQETIYGTKTLARLEAIKEALDPNYMFDCAGCIGNNRKKETDTKDDETTSGETDTKEEETTSGETDTKEDKTTSEEPSGESSTGSIASVKVTVCVVLSVVGGLFVW
jgi:hypothetical protein